MEGLEVIGRGEMKGLEVIGQAGIEVKMIADSISPSGWKQFRQLPLGQGDFENEIK